MPRRAPCAVFALMLVACVSCRDQPAEPAGEGSVVHTVVQAHIASAQVTRVVVTITPADVSQDLAYDAATSMFTGTVAVAAGDQTVRADAYAGATLVGSGSAPVTVAPNRTGQVLITIPDASGPGSVPDHSPVVTTLVVPSTSVAPGGQLALSATAFDADGDPIASAWSAAPAGCGSFASPASLSTTFTAGGPASAPSPSPSPRGRSATRAAPPSRCRGPPVTAFP